MRHTPTSKALGRSLADLGRCKGEGLTMSEFEIQVAVSNISFRFFTPGEMLWLVFFSMGRNHQLEIHLFDILIRPFFWILTWSTRFYANLRFFLVPLVSFHIFGCEKGASHSSTVQWTDECLCARSSVGSVRPIFATFFFVSQRIWGIRKLRTASKWQAACGALAELIS